MDAAILKELMPKVIALIKSSIGMGSKVAISHFLTLMCLSMKQELQPFAGTLKELECKLISVASPYNRLKKKKKSCSPWYKLKCEILYNR